MKSWISRTRQHRAGAMDGLNLFFGALLGANLGTLEGLKLVHYLGMIAVLAARVMALRMISTSDRRAPAIALLGFYGVVLVAVAVSPGLRPEGLLVDDLNKLVATMAVWIFLAMIIELAPVSEQAAPAVTGGEAAPQVSG